MITFKYINIEILYMLVNHTHGQIIPTWEWNIDSQLNVR